MITQFMTDMNSEALVALNVLANINKEEVHKMLATKATDQVIASYGQRWMGRRRVTEAYSIYGKIKEALEGQAIGILTGSTISSIRGASSVNDAIVKLVGTWPNKGFVGGKEIPLTEVLRNETLEKLGLTENLDAQWEMKEGEREKIESAKQYISNEDDYFVKVGLTAEGFTIKWPEWIKKAIDIEDRNYPSRTFEAKLAQGEYGTGPGTLRKNPVEFLYLDLQQCTELTNMVSTYIDNLLGFKGTATPSLPVEKPYAALREGKVSAIRRSPQTPTRELPPKDVMLRALQDNLDSVADELMKIPQKFQREVLLAASEVFSAFGLSEAEVGKLPYVTDIQQIMGRKLGR